MPLAFMERISIPGYEKEIKNSDWEYKDSLESPGEGPSMVVPVGVKNLEVFFTVENGGIGKVQHTVSTQEDLIAGQAVWIDWDIGEIGENSQDSSTPVTALRQVNVTGTTTLTVKAV